MPCKDLLYVVMVLLVTPSVIAAQTKTCYLSDIKPQPIASFAEHRLQGGWYVIYTLNSALEQFEHPIGTFEMWTTDTFGFSLDVFNGDGGCHYTGTFPLKRVSWRGVYTIDSLTDPEDYLLHVVLSFHRDSHLILYGCKDIAEESDTCDHAMLYIYTRSPNPEPQLLLRLLRKLRRKTCIKEDDLSPVDQTHPCDDI